MDWFDKKRDEMLEDDYFIDAQFMANSRREALDLVGDDRFYPGSDELDEDDFFAKLDEEDDDDEDFGWGDSDDDD